MSTATETYTGKKVRVNDYLLESETERLLWVDLPDGTRVRNSFVKQGSLTFTPRDIKTDGWFRISANNKFNSKGSDEGSLTIQYTLDEYIIFNLYVPMPSFLKAKQHRDLILRSFNDWYNPHIDGDR